MFTWNAEDGWQFHWFAALILAMYLFYQFAKAYRKRVRRKSLHRDEQGFYVWVELDGTAGRSRNDPRPEWDRRDSEDDEDGDSDGGGD